MRPILSAATSTFSAALLKVAASHASKVSDGCAHLATFSFQKQRQRKLSSSTLLSLRPAGQHSLLPLPGPPPLSGDAVNDTTTTSVSASEIRDGFLKSGINKVAFIRHGNTASATVDFDRELTELGRSQACAAGASYGVDTLYPYYERVVLSSAAPRCVETAKLFLDSSMKRFAEEYSTGHDDHVTTYMPPLKLCPQLYDGTMQPEGSRLFRSIGYAPLRRYLENPDAGDAEAARCVLGEYARVSLDVLWDAVACDEQNNSHLNTHCEGQTLLFFAHAVYLPSAALAFVAAIGGSNGTGSADISRGGIDLILDTNTKEAEGYCVSVDAMSVSLLNRPEISHE